MEELLLSPVTHSVQNCSARGLLTQEASQELQNENICPQFWGQYIVPPIATRGFGVSTSSLKFSLSYLHYFIDVPFCGDLDGECFSLSPAAELSVSSRWRCLVGV